MSKTRFCPGKWALTLIPAVLMASVAIAGAAPPDYKGMQARLAACATCHGKNGEGNLGVGDAAGGGGVYPRLAGQPTDYLYKQLLRFKSATRTGIPPVDTMQQLLVSLPASYLRLIAEYYHRATPPFPPRPPKNTERWQRGRELVRHGAPDKNVAACSSCHGADLEGKPPATPALAGQYARYLLIQFDHWSQGARHNAVHEHVAQVLTTPQIEAMAHYLASLRPADSEGAAE